MEHGNKISTLFWATASEKYVTFKLLVVLCDYVHINNAGKPLNCEVESC